MLNFIINSEYLQFHIIIYLKTRFLHKLKMTGRLLRYTRNGTSLRRSETNEVIFLFFVQIASLRSQ